MGEPVGSRLRANLDAGADVAGGEEVLAVGPEESQGRAQQCFAGVSQVQEGLEAQGQGQGQDQRAFHLARQWVEEVGHNLVTC